MIIIWWSSWSSTWSYLVQGRRTVWKCTIWTFLSASLAGPGGDRRRTKTSEFRTDSWINLFSLGIIIIIIIMMIVIIMIITKGENGRVGVKLCLVVKLAAGAKMGAGGEKPRRNFMKKNWHQRKPNVKKHKVNMIIIFISNMILIVSAVGIFLWFRSRSKFAKSIECQKFTRS